MNFRPPAPPALASALPSGCVRDAASGMGLPLLLLLIVWESALDFGTTRRFFRILGLEKQCSILRILTQICLYL